MNTDTTKRYRLLINLPDGAIIGDTYKKVGDRYFNESLDAIKSPVVEHNAYFTWQVENCPTYFEEVLPVSEPVKIDMALLRIAKSAFDLSGADVTMDEVINLALAKGKPKQSPPLSEIKEGEDKPVLFTTEDGVGVVMYQNLFVVELPDYKLSQIIKLDGIRHDSSIYFSTKEAAEQYIIDNKPCLSLNDVMKFVEPACHPSEENFDEIGLRDFVTKKLKSLNP